MPDRRTIIAAGLSSAWLGVAEWSSPLWATEAPSGVDPIANAFLYALPLYEIERSRRQFLAKGQQVNTIAHVRQLADASMHQVTTPNSDTLYSSAWLDVSRGPVEIYLASATGRYQSVALMDGFSNNIAVLHPTARATKFRVIRSRKHEGPQHGPTIFSSTDKLWLLVRTFLLDGSDLGAAHLAQDGIVVTGPLLPSQNKAALLAPAMTGSADGVFLAMRDLTAASPDDGFRAGDVMAKLFALPSEQRLAAMQAGRAAAAASLNKRATSISNGWSYPQANLGQFGTDYLYRAQIALGGLGALPLSEAIYLRAAGDGPRGVMIGDRPRHWHVAADRQPPVGAFWSLTLYVPDGNGNFYFFDHPARRYSIGSSMPDLVRSFDGQLDILIAPEQSGSAANWLPCPAGPFVRIFRAYRPSSALLDRSYVPPPIA